LPDPFARLLELPGVFEAVDAARGSVDVLLRELRGRELRRLVGDVTTESLRRAAWASAELETGTPVDLATFHAPFADDDLGRTCGGALRLTTELSGLADVWSRAPLQALARLHTLAARDVLPADELGRPRPDAQVSARLSGLADLLIAPTQAPAVVVSAVVHGEIAALAPFSWGNGLVARAAARLVLLARGLDPRAASVPEEGHLRLGRDVYGGALEHYVLGTPDGVARWVGHCAQAVAIGGQVGREVARAVAGGAAG
jgi:hypothetical protein